MLRSFGFRKISNGVMRVLTDQLNAHIQKVSQKLGLPIIWWANEGNGTNGAKLDFVQQKGAKRDHRKPNQVLCILAAMETCRTFATRELQTKMGRVYEKMYGVRKQVKHYYIYFYDRVLGGPCYLKLCTYLPFAAEFYFNGLGVIELELKRRSVRYRKDGNAFVYLEDPKLVEQLAWSLTGQKVQERIDYWMNHLFRFDRGVYSRRPSGLVHKWYCSQVEVSTNILFKSASFCRSLFERLLDKYSRIGLPDSSSQIFGLRRPRKTSSSHRRLYDNDACLKSWSERNSVKLYNKRGNFLRVETTINGPKSLGLKKPVVHLRQYLTHGNGCNQRLMHCLSDVDVRSLSREELLAADQAVVSSNGGRRAAVDLRNQRQLALAQELLKAKYSAFGFRTKDLYCALNESYKNPAQIRYELAKYRARGWVEKMKGKSYYRVTELGYAMMWVKTASKMHFENPIISTLCKIGVKQSVSQPSRLEQGYDLVQSGLTLITKELCVRRAA